MLATMLSNVSELQVRYNEVDQMGIVHHSVYYVWLEVARFEFARRVLGCSIDDLVTNRLELPVVETYCRYMRSARYGDRIQIHTFVETGETSMLNLFYRVVRASDGDLLAEARTRHVFTRPGGGLLLSVPAFLAARIETARKAHAEYFLEKPRHIDTRRGAM